MRRFRLWALVLAFWLGLPPWSDRESHADVMALQESTTYPEQVYLPSNHPQDFKVKK